MKLHAFLVGVILFCGMTSLHGHEIHLTNGKIIETENVWKDGGKVKYEKYGGTISISHNQVKDIVYIKTRDRESSPSRGQSATGQNAVLPSGNDLAAKLKARLNPKNPVEEASMCTISVKTATGFGSGFFISNDGFIITNRHVVRGSEQQNKQIDEKFDQARQNLGEYRQYLDQANKQIIRYRADLKNNRVLLKDMQKQARTETDKRYIASKRNELIDFENFIREKERKHKKEKKEYHSKKQEVDNQVKKFRSGQQKLARQNSFEVILADETRLYASLYKVSSQHDLALLKLSGYQTPFLKPVMRKDLSQGQNVFTVGSPINLSLKNTVTSGVVSGFRENFIQTNAQIYPGNSGGPLINDKGEVIGINTKKLVTRKFEGLGFAIPIGVALAEFQDHLQ